MTLSIQVIKHVAKNKLLDLDLKKRVKFYQCYILNELLKTVTDAQVHDLLVFCS